MRRPVRTLQSLLRADSSLSAFIPRATVLALSGSLLLSAITYAALVGSGFIHRVHAAPDREVTAIETMGLVLVAPMLETALLAVTIRLLQLCLDSQRQVAATAAILWGLLHATFGALWFFGTVWSFFVFAVGYQAFQSRSALAAFLAAAVPHSLVNAAIVTALLLLPATA